MIHRLNEQVLDSPDSAATPRERKQDVTAVLDSGPALNNRNQLSSATSTLRTMVEENEKQPTKLPAGNLQRVGSVSEATNDGDDEDSDLDGVDRAAKRQKIIT